MSSKKLKKTKFQIRQNCNRFFSEKFKRSKVQEILKNQITVQQLSDLYQVSRSSIYKWIYKYSVYEPGTKTVVEMESESMKTKRLFEQVAELERIIGQKQLEIDYLNKAFEIASKEVGYDLKKKYAPTRSSTSGTIGSDLPTR